MRFTRKQLVAFTLVMFAVAGVVSPGFAQQPVTAVLNDGVVDIDATLFDGEHLWVAAGDVKRINGFEPKPEGFCSADICIPFPKTDAWVRTLDGQPYYCVTRFAEKIDQPVVADAERGVWGFGTVPLLQQELFTEAVAPDFALRDREDNLVRLSDFRGKKVLLLTWASW